MKTECFRPLVVTSSKKMEEEPRTVEGVFLSRGWCRTEGVLGSASCELGNSKVVCYAYVPRPSTKLITGFESGSVDCEVFFAPHITFDVEDEQSSRQKALSKKISDAIAPAILLDRYPKSTIYISAIILQSSDMDFSALVNAISLALCDGSFEIRDILASYSASLTPSEGVKSTVSIVSLPRLQEITGIDCVGSLSPSQLMKTIEMLEQNCIRMRELIVDAVKARTS